MRDAVSPSGGQKAVRAFLVRSQHYFQLICNEYQNMTSDNSLHELLLSCAGTDIANYNSANLLPYSKMGEEIMCIWQGYEIILFC